MGVPWWETVIWFWSDYMHFLNFYQLIICLAWLYKNMYMTCSGSRTSGKIKRSLWISHPNLDLGMKGKDFGNQKPKQSLNLMFHSTWRNNGTWQWCFQTTILPTVSRPFNHYGSEQFASYCFFMMTWSSFRIKNQKHLCCLRCICLVHFSNIQPILEDSGDNPSGSFS